MTSEKSQRGYVFVIIESPQQFVYLSIVSIGLISTALAFLFLCFLNFLKFHIKNEVEAKKIS